MALVLLGVRRVRGTCGAGGVRAGGRRAPPQPDSGACAGVAGAGASPRAGAGVSTEDGPGW